MWTAKKIKYVHISWIYWQKCLHLLVHVEILPLCAVVYGDSSRWHKNSKTLKWLLNIENKEPQSGYVTNFWRKWVMGSEGFHSFRWHFPGNMKFVWFFSFVWFRFRNRPKRITIDKNYHLSTHRRLLMNALMRFLFFLLPFVVLYAVVKQSTQTRTNTNFTNDFPTRFTLFSTIY